MKAPYATASASDHSNNVGDQVPFFVNQVGLLNNPGKPGHKLQLILDTMFQLLLRLSNAKLERACVGRSLKLLEVVKFRNVISTEFYSKASLLPVRQKIHWFSFINSIIIIVLLMGLLALLIVRRLKNDMKRFSNSDEEEDKEVSWKYIHGDVFRYPPNMSLSGAVVGVGTQLLAMLFILFLLPFFGDLYPYNRGALFTSLVFICPTSIIGGYTAAAFHNQFSVTGWVIFFVIWF